jgi:hypothetical protein
MRGEERVEREEDEALDFEPAFVAPALEDLEGVECEEDMLAGGLTDVVGC